MVVMWGNRLQYKNRRRERLFLLISRACLALTCTATIHLVIPFLIDLQKSKSGKAPLGLPGNIPNAPLCE